jgi:hypothetical protein
MPVPHCGLPFSPEPAAPVARPAFSEPDLAGPVGGCFAGFQVRRVAVAPRSPDSAADRELTARLAGRGLAGPGTRYERWRRAGLLPRHERRGAGRGHGSVSVLDPATVEIAAALARHTRQGRDLRAAVVAWFFEAGRPAGLGEAAGPEPPEDAVTAALAWAVRTDPGYRVLQRARAAATEAQQDQFYEDAATLARRNPDRSSGMDPAAVTCAGAGALRVSQGRAAQPWVGAADASSLPRTGWC